MYAQVMKALRDGRAVSSSQFLAIGAMAGLALGWNYVWASSHAAIYDTWPLYGIAMSLLITTLCLLAIPFGRRQDWSVHKTRVTLCMVLLSICIRHYEENIFDLLQRENSFIKYVNNMFDAWVPAFHCSDFEQCMFDKYNTMAYNTAGLWPLFMLMPFFFTSTPLFAICACGVALVSSCGHVVASLVMLSYCPGTASALLLVCPSAMYAAYLLCQHYFVGHPSVYVAGVAAGGFCHVAVGFVFFFVKMLGYVPDCLFPIGMYSIFSIDLGVVCRLFGGPTEKFIANKKLERDRARHRNFDDLEDENSALL